MELIANRKTALCPYFQNSTGNHHQISSKTTLVLQLPKNLLFQPTITRIFIFGLKSTLTRPLMVTEHSWYSSLELENGHKVIKNLIFMR